MNGSSNHADAALRLANERLAHLRDESARDRLRGRSGRGIGPVGALRAALATLRAAVPPVDPDGPLVLPRLTGYPYRS